MAWSIKVTPPDRAADVIHYLITGQLFCGRSLEGVTWEQVEDKRLDKLNKLAVDMHKTNQELHAILDPIIKANKCRWCGCNFGAHETNRCDGGCAAK